MSLFGEAVKPSTVAADTQEKYSRRRYNELRDNFEASENEVLRTLGNEDYIEYNARDAGREAEDATQLMQDRAAEETERRGIVLPGRDQASLDRNNTYARKTNAQKAESRGEVAMINADRKATARAVDTGNRLMRDSFNALGRASSMEAAANRANAGDKPGFLEKAAGVAQGAVSGFSMGGPAGAVGGGALAAASMF